MPSICRQGPGKAGSAVDRSRVLGQDEVCQVRGYGFDQRGNRTSQNLAAGSTCQNTQPVSQVQRGYDAFDRVLTGAGGSGTYTYDALGRQLTIPATDAPDSAEGNISLGYYHDDSARTITQGDTTLTYTLDGSGRRITESRTVDGSLKGWTTNHYRDGGDNPAWVDTMTGSQDTRVVYSDLVSEDLSVSVTTGTGMDPTVELTLLTPRGDVAATIIVPDSGTATGLDSYTHYTEYGIPVTAQPQGNTGVAASGYGWLGAHQRSTTEIGILLMGSRLYNPDTGLFTSIDPVWGGNDTIYGYPNDPINNCDVSGRASCMVLFYAVEALRSELQRRHLDLIQNRRNLPLYERVSGKPGTIRGHQEQFRNKQEALRRAIARYDKSGCKWSRFRLPRRDYVGWTNRRTPQPRNISRYRGNQIPVARTRVPSRFRIAPTGRGGGGLPLDRW